QLRAQVPARRGRGAVRRRRQHRQPPQPLLARGQAQRLRPGDGPLDQGHVAAGEAEHVPQHGQVPRPRAVPGDPGQVPRAALQH
ncbi:hypothetical protein BN1723_018188, partial [Verticillium longisporum]